MISIEAVIHGIRSTSRLVRKECRLSGREQVPRSGFDDGDQGCFIVVLYSLVSSSRGSHISCEAARGPNVERYRRGLGRGILNANIAKPKDSSTPTSLH